MMELNDYLGNIDTYIFCSTQNQIVNYIPFQMIVEASEDKERNFQSFNLTYKSSDVYQPRFSNKDWDANLYEVLDKKFPLQRFNRIEIEMDRVFQEDKILGKLGEIGFEHGKRYLWNVTGGQKNILLTILALLSQERRPEGGHILIYLEGNTGQIIGNIIGKTDEWEEVGNYRVGDLEIEQVLTLAGFKARNFKSDCITDKNKNFLAEFYNCYCKDGGLRKAFLMLNRKEDESDTKQCFLTRLSELMRKEEKVVKEQLEELYAGNNTNKAGYYLEWLTYYAVNKAVKTINKEKKKLSDQILGSLYVNNADDKVSPGERKIFCEFDLVIMTVTGQLIIFECKSGIMDSENAKSRNYTAYAVGGVYGKPILITPLIEEECSERPKLSKKEEYKSVISTVNAAKRAGLEYWPIDKIKERLESLLIDMKVEVDG